MVLFRYIIAFLKNLVKYNSHRFKIVLLKKIPLMNVKEIKIRVSEYDDITDLGEVFKNLLTKAREVAKKAYAPYSGFYVGAAVLLENGRVVTGNNQENAAYPSGLCAERVALFYANANYPKQKVLAIAVTATNKTGTIYETVSPCGSCRQVLLETEVRFENQITIILDGNKIQVLEGIDNLLPLGFRPNSLK